MLLETPGRVTIIAGHLQINPAETMHRLTLIMMMFATAAFAQTAELIKMPITELQGKAESGDAAAMVQLAMRLNLGIGVAQNLNKTRELIEKSALAGNTTAIGMCAEQGWGRPKDYDFAFKSYTKAANTGDLTAIRNLSRCYSKGIGCSADKDKAGELIVHTPNLSDDPAALFYLSLERLSRGTEFNSRIGFQGLERVVLLSNSSVAKVNLAGCLERGLGCDKDQDGAIKLYAASANDGCPSAMRILGSRYQAGNGVPKDPAKANELYRKAGELGDEEALAWLASNTKAESHSLSSSEKPREKTPFVFKNDQTLDMLDKGIKYMKSGDAVAATRLFEQASNLGDGAAMVLLGDSCKDGLGMAKDLGRAITLYQRGGELGIGPGYYRLAALYIDGNGVAKDLARANYFLEKAAALGHAQSCCVLGLHHENGSGCTKDINKAIELYNKAAEMGSGAAHSNLGTLYALGKGVAQDWAKAYELFKKAGALGDGEGCRNLGQAYQEGILLKKDLEKANELFAIAANASDSYGCYFLAVNYESGFGIRKDTLKADELYEKSGDLGLAGGYFTLALRCKNDDKANRFYRKAGDLGSGDACYYLGRNYEDGKGVAKDLDAARMWVEKGAKLGSKWAIEWLKSRSKSGGDTQVNSARSSKDIGNISRDQTPDALVNLGRKYRKGDGVARDLAKANELFQKAAEMGSGEANYELGFANDYGLGLPKNVGKANELYRRAGELGCGAGFDELGVNYTAGNGVTKDLNQAVELFRKASELGCASGFFNLGSCYDSGIGVNQDYKRANQCYQKAGDLGYADAYTCLGCNYCSGNGVPKDERAANELFEKAGKMGSSQGYANLAASYRSGRGVEEDWVKAKRLGEMADELAKTEHLNRPDPLSNGTQQDNQVRIAGEAIKRLFIEGVDKAISNGIDTLSGKDDRIPLTGAEREAVISRWNASRMLQYQQTGK